jgi:hypothetical protein
VRFFKNSFGQIALMTGICQLSMLWNIEKDAPIFVFRAVKDLKP